MHILFDEAGKFLAGRILSESEAAAQVELDSGRRIKVKSANQLLRFADPSPGELLAQAQALAAEVDPQLAWEFAPEGEFGFAALAAEYFSAAPGTLQQAAALLALHQAPHYFRRAGKGRFRKAEAEVVAQALAAIEKKRQLAAQIGAWADELAAGRCPPAIGEQLYRILFRPDKNAPEYKAVVEAARNAQMAPLSLLTRAGAITSAYQFHWQRFLFEHFPRGTAFPAVAAPQVAEALPLAPVQAWSIDDAHTTEIDDAISLRGLGSGTVVLGVHIAAPGLAIAPGDALDAIGRERLSTVYMPGYKITMLPDEAVQACTLLAGQAAPAVSLYVTLDEASLAVQSSETRIERVPIAANLRHEDVDALVTPEWLDGATGANGATPLPEPVTRQQLAFLHRLARHLKAARELARGKPETFNRPDYSFHLASHDDSVPTGEEAVTITQRARGAPLDLMVSELMILANSTWGEWLKRLGVPAIYRSQASLLPGIKVRMGTKALPHAGIGVPSYCWSTSPLRRYVDLVNQWQIIAAARHGTAAALAAPFKPRSAELLAIISAFDAAYSAYGAHQAGMERFWTLQYLAQQGITELTVGVLREQAGGAWLVRAEGLPLVFEVMGTQLLARGARARVRLGAIDPIALDVRGSVAEVLAAQPLALPDEAAADDEEPEAGPLAIAVDLSDAPPAGAGADNAPS